MKVLNITDAELDRVLAGRADPKNQKEFWDGRAEGFAKAVLGEGKTDDFVFKNIEHLALIASDDHIADIGCGPGRHAYDLRKRGASYLGFDISPEMIRLAKENAAAKGFDVDFTYENWEEHKGRFDIVFASMTPAVNSLKALEKYCGLAKKYCIMQRFLEETDNISPLFGLPYLNEGHNNPGYTFALVNSLWKMGYFPQIITETEHSEFKMTTEYFKQRYASITERMPQGTNPDIDSILAPIVRGGEFTVKQKRVKALIVWGAKGD